MKGIRVIFIFAIAVLAAIIVGASFLSKPKALAQAAFNADSLRAAAAAEVRSKIGDSLAQAQMSAAARKSDSLAAVRAAAKNKRDREDALAGRKQAVADSIRALEDVANMSERRKAAEITRMRVDELDAQLNRLDYELIELQAEKERIDDAFTPLRTPATKRAQLDGVNARIRDKNAQIQQTQAQRNKLNELIDGGDLWDAEK